MSKLDDHFVRTYKVTSYLLNGKIFYQVGDTTILKSYTTGYWTHDGTQLCFFIPCGKLFSKEVKNFKFTSLKMTVRQNNGYCIGTGSELANISLTGNTFNSVLRSNEGGLDVAIIFGKTYARENNSTCGIVYDARVVFTE